MRVTVNNYFDLHEVHSTIREDIWFIEIINIYPNKDFSTEHFPFSAWSFWIIVSLCVYIYVWVSSFSMKVKFYFGEMKNKYVLQYTFFEKTKKFLFVFYWIKREREREWENIIFFKYKTEIWFYFSRPEVQKRDALRKHKRALRARIHFTNNGKTVSKYVRTLMWKCELCFDR